MARGAPSERRTTRPGRTPAVGAHARWLFGIGAFFNLAVAVALLVLRDALGPSIGLAPAEGTNLVWVYMTAALVGVFGYAYARAAADPWRYRAYIELGVIGKLLAVVAVTVPWLRGAIGPQLPLLVGGDLVFAALFWDYLRRYPADAEAR